MTSLSRTDALLACKTGDEFVKKAMGGWRSLALYPEPKTYLLGESTKVFEPARQDDTNWAHSLYPAREFEVTGSLIYLMHSLMAGSILVADKKRFPKLSDENFGEFQTWLLEAFGTEEAKTQERDGVAPIAREDIDAEKFDAFMALTVTHDLGKAKKFLEEVERYGGTVAASHDETIALAVDHPEVSRLLTSIDRLNDEQKADVKAVFKANCNLGRIMQLESKAAELEGLKDLTEHQANLLVAHIATDVAGALGHIKPIYPLVGSDA